MGITGLREHEPGAAVGSFAAAAVWALIWGGIGIGMLYGGIQSGTKDRSKVLLKKAVGPVNLVGVEKHTGGEHPTTYVDHELHIGPVAFDVEEEVAGFMMQGDVYAIYYVTQMDGSGRQVLSAEKL